MTVRLECAGPLVVNTGAAHPFTRNSRRIQYRGSCPSGSVAGGWGVGMSLARDGEHGTGAANVGQ